MNNIFTGIVAGGAVTAVALLLLMQGRDEVRTNQDLHRVDAQIERARFDEEFSRAWGKPNQEEKDSTSRLAQLEKRRDELEATKATQSATAEADTQALRDALNEHDQADGQALRDAMKQHDNQQ